jgi:hypothetical protein
MIQKVKHRRKHYNVRMSNNDANKVEYQVIKCKDHVCILHASYAAQAV